MSATCLGMWSWSRVRDDDGHRTYSSRWKVLTDDPLDGPSVVGTASGLPAIGDPWTYGNDNDTAAFCHPKQTITACLDGEQQNLFWVDVDFSTKPIRRCQDTQIEDPLSEPYKISGSFAEAQQKAYTDRFGKPIANSAGYPYELQKDLSQPTVTVSINRATSPVYLISTMIEGVNDSTLWGLPAKCIKFSSASWERLLYGTCTYYYKLSMEFRIKAPYVTAIGVREADGTLVSSGTTYGGWVDVVPDEGPTTINAPAASGAASAMPDQTKSLVVKDAAGENKPHVFLDGRGGIAIPVGGITPFILNVFELYTPMNLLLLPIPSSL